jgi:uncharacterized membrane protein
MSDGYMTGFILFYTILASLLCVYLVPRMLIMSAQLKHVTEMHVETCELNEALREQLGAYQDLIDDEYMRTKTLIKGFEKIDRLNIVRPIKKKENR